MLTVRAKATRLDIGCPYEPFLSQTKTGLLPLPISLAPSLYPGPGLCSPSPPPLLSSVLYFSVLQPRSPRVIQGVVPWLVFQILGKDTPQLLSSFELGQSVYLTLCTLRLVLHARSEELI